MLAETVSMSLPPETAATPCCFARAEVYRDARDVADLWRTLEGKGACSVYQTQGWVLPWIETLGRKAGMSPLFVVARATSGRVVFLACLGVVRRGPFRFAKWLGCSDANFNLPLHDPEIAWSRSELVRLFREAAALCGRDAPHFFYLPNQPANLRGYANPLRHLPHWTAPSPAFGGKLSPDAEAFFAKQLSKDTRKKLRKKEAKLKSFGPLHHVIAADPATQERVIDTFIAQKAERVRAQGISFDVETPEMRAFLKRASAPIGTGIEMHALVVGDRAEDGRIVAIYGGGAHGGQWSGMINAFDTDEEIARCSPGDLLLMRIIAKACGDGFSYFDLGIGAARYKQTFCEDQIDLFDATIATGIFGAFGAKLMAARQAAKRTIKANDRLFRLSLRIAALRK